MYNCGCQGWGWKSFCLIGRVSVLQDKKCSIDCAMVLRYLVLLNCTLKVGSDDKFYIYLIKMVFKCQNIEAEINNSLCSSPIYLSPPLPKITGFGFSIPPVSTTNLVRWH
jgi:hypothetical protein